MSDHNLADRGAGRPTAEVVLTLIRGLPPEERAVLMENLRPQMAELCPSFVVIRRQDAERLRDAIVQGEEWRRHATEVIEQLREGWRKAAKSKAGPKKDSARLCIFALAEVLNADGYTWEQVHSLLTPLSRAVRRQNLPQGRNLEIEVCKERKQPDWPKAMESALKIRTQMIIDRASKSAQPNTLIPQTQPPRDVAE